MTNESQQAALAQLRRVLRSSAPWEAWLEQSGELPPDFTTLPANDDLPDLLAGVSTPADWQEKRKHTKALLHQWMLGTVPPAPEHIRAEILSEARGQGATIREVRLHFGPQAQASLWLELLIPDGEGPFPVFMTQDNHRGWSQIALSREYIACTYAGADSRDDTDSFLAAYPDDDWSRITRRAWAASRCLDYLETLPQVDRDKVAITGHSRNGKLSLIASALDERFAAVISSSSGAGGVLSARYFSEQHFGEGIELITHRFPEWFHPRWRFFVGREQHLPVDLHDLVALSAPRPCLLSIALNDMVSSAWALEQTYHAVQPVYQFLDAPDQVAILWRRGSHETWPRVIDRYLDWCDNAFGRGDYPFPERLLYPHDWEKWQANASVTPDSLPAGDAPLTDKIQAMLGAEPPVVTGRPANAGRRVPHIDALMGQMPAPDVEKLVFEFGDHITGDVYQPVEEVQPGEKRPALLWLPPYAPANGYAAIYRRGEPPVWTLARAGYAVFCFDPIGTGQRIDEVEYFYDRQPDWSLFGKLVRDARAALDMMTTLPLIDPARIYVVGYGLGALIGLHLNALDARVAGFAGVCLPSLRHLTQSDIPRSLRLFWPQLQWFAGQPDALPYTTADLLAACGSRPALVVSPQLDRETPLTAMQQAVEQAREQAQHLTHVTPEAYNHFDPDMQALVINWLQSQSGR